jgi:hypothetical protein
LSSFQTLNKQPTNHQPNQASLEKRKQTNKQLRLYLCSANRATSELSGQQTIIPFNQPESNCLSKQQPEEPNSLLPAK